MNAPAANLAASSLAVAPSSAKSGVQSIDPATGALLAEFDPTPIADFPAIMARARSAQSAWGGWSVESRGAQIRRLHDVLYRRRQELAEWVTRETGKPQAEALFADVLIALDAAGYYARHAPALLGDEYVPHHNLAVKAKSGWLRYEPFGVIGIISPWNYPLAIPLCQIIPAVAAGNAVVMKCSELTPACGVQIAKYFAEAGFPPGLVQVIQGAADAGAALVEARPDKLIFTGSVAAGRKVAAACAERLIPSVLELGGKNAMIVLADADLEAASSAAVWGSFMNCGQACLSMERIYVEYSVAGRFTQLCVAKTRQLKLGPGSDPENEIGPMVRPAAVDRVEAQILEAVSAGARLLIGGRRRPDLGPNYLEPAVLEGVNQTMRLMREETFGPVLPIMTVANENEAVALANDSEFGLSASVWTHDNEKGKRLAARVHAGAVMVNDVASHFGIAEAPHGGRGLSGWGRTHSRLGLLEMVQAKYVDVDRLPRWPKAWWFGYNRDATEVASAFLDFTSAPGWMDRWRGGLRAARAYLRKQRSPKVE